MRGKFWKRQKSRQTLRMVGMTLMEVMVATALTTMIFSMCLIIMRQGNNILTEVYDTTEGKNEFNLVYDTMVPMLKSSERILQLPSGREWELQYGEGQVHKVEWLHTGGLEVDGEAIGVFERFELNRESQWHVKLICEGGRLDRIERTVYCERLVPDGA